jgi:hypothetical protein
MFQTRLTGTQKQKPETKQRTEKEKERANTVGKETAGTSTRTRSNDADSRLSREDIEALEGQEVANAKEGMTYIESTLLKVPGTPYSIAELAGTLFQASVLPGIKTSRANSNAIRAIAFILQEIDVDKNAQAFAEAAMTKMEEQIKAIKEEARNIAATATTKVAEIADTLKTRLAEIVDNTAEGMENGDARHEQHDDQASRDNHEVQGRPKKTGVTRSGGAPPPYSVQPKAQGKR